MDNPPKPILIIYFEGQETGGVTGVIENLVPSISLKYQVMIVHRDTLNLNTWCKNINLAVCYPVALNNFGDVFGWFDIFRILKLIKLFKQATIVHFHLHTPFSCLSAIFAAKVARVKSVLTTEHYITQLQFVRRRKLPFILRQIRELKITFLMAMKSKSFNIIDRVITVSETNNKYLLSVFGSAVGERSITIPNGIDTSIFDLVGINKSDVFVKVDIRNLPSHIVTVVASLNNQKGHEYLLRSIPDIRKQLPKVLFLLVGDGHLRSLLESLVNQLGISDNVIFTGRRNDIPDILAISDLFVLPSLFEGMPLSVLEAMAAGKAVVATNVDGTAEIVENIVTGFLVPPKESEILGEKISKLLMDKALRDKFGEKGKKRAQYYFSLGTMTKRYLEIYSNIILSKIN